MGYPVNIALIDAGTGQNIDADTGQNVVVVRNPINSTVPSEVVRVELVTYAEDEIGPSKEIVVDFSGPSPGFRIRRPGKHPQKQGYNTA